MAGRIRRIEEKVQPVLVALDQINVKAAAREAGIPPGTLRDDLKKIKKALPEVLADRKRGPKPKNRVEGCTAKQSETEEPIVCPECGGKVTKNGTYWVLNWVLMLTMGWMGGYRKCSSSAVAARNAEKKSPRRNGCDRLKHARHGGSKSIG